MIIFKSFKLSVLLGGHAVSHRGHTDLNAFISQFVKYLQFPKIHYATRRAADNHDQRPMRIVKY